MVKNTTGGSGHKKFAHKHSTGHSNNRLRVSEDECEIYAIVTKTLGNNMFHCLGIDNVTRLGLIRGKFTGRGKRDNMVVVGKWVLVGLREWDTATSTTQVATTKQLQKCDLLEVYTDLDKQRLKDSVPANWNNLEKGDASNHGSNNEDDDFVFGTDKDFEREGLIKEMMMASTKKITLSVEEEAEEEINIDDI
jgi:translation initiation factor IF-1